jgi:hypothetical protein
LTHVDFLFEVAVKESRLDVHVVEAPHFLRHQRKDTDRYHARHRSERIVVVDPHLLDKTARNQPCLVFDHRPSLVLQLEHPFHGDGAMAVGQIDQLPSAVLLDGLELLFHCSAPRRIALSLGVGSRYTGVRQVELDVEVALRRGWQWLIADDVGHCTVAQRFIVVVGVQTILEIL